MKLQYTLIANEDGGIITLFVPGVGVRAAHDSHPYFEQIVEGVLAGDPSVIDLFDLAATVATKFERLSERVSVKGGKLYLDGVEVNNALSDQVLRFLDAGIEDWRPLVAFFENVQANPNEHSRAQLFEWLARREFTITADGLIVGYKGVRTDGNSIHAGKAIVDGEEVSGHIPNTLGAVIEMPRDQVQWDPSVGCHTGLHVGTFDYANGFAQGRLLEVHVNPRDVVSVPTDSDAAKMRVCRYTVVGTLDTAYSAPLRPYDQDVDAWGDGEYEDDEDYWV